MANERDNQQNTGNNRNQLPEDVLNAEVDPSSMQDPLQVQLNKQSSQQQSDEAALEQQRKEAMTERD